MFTVTFIYRIFDSIDSYFGKIILNYQNENKLLDQEVKNIINTYRIKAGYDQIYTLGILSIFQDIKCSDEDSLAFDMYLDYSKKDDKVYLTVGYHTHTLDE